MDTNRKAVDAIYKEHCWRKGKARKPANKAAGKDVHGLSVKERADVEERKSLLDHPVEEDLF